jgi:hypothetical protein
MNKKDYNLNGSFCRLSVSGIIIKSRKVAIIHSKKYDYYKFSSGGIMDESA